MTDHAGRRAGRISLKSVKGSKDRSDFILGKIWEPFCRIGEHLKIAKS